jgi:hypothetical protein
MVIKLFSLHYQAVKPYIYNKQLQLIDFIELIWNNKQNFPKIADKHHCVMGDFQKLPVKIGHLVKKISILLTTLSFSSCWL